MLIIRYLQSTMVRLRQSKVKRDNYINIQFTIHYGEIKTPYGRLYPIDIPNLQSTMVRLRLMPG